MRQLLIQVVLAVAVSSSAAAQDCDLFSLFGIDKHPTLGSVKSCLDHGGDVNALGRRGRPLLGIAAMKSDPEIIRLLIANGADVNARHESG